MNTLVFDRSLFLARMDGDEPLAGEVIEVFLRECPKLLQGVRQATKQRDAPLLERAAHALKGSVADVAAPQAFKAAHSLEAMAKDGNVDGADAALMNLEIAIQELVCELQNSETSPP